MKKDYLITESPMKALLVFSIPMIIGNLFQQFYTMADSIVVGQFVSEEALAAVGASYALTNVFISVAIGGGVGASVIASQYFGARRYTQMKRAIFTSLLSFFALSMLLGAFGLFAGHALMRLLNTPENIIGLAVTYLNIYFLGLPFLFLYNVVSATFNALGRSRIPLYLLIFSSLFNIVLDIYMVRSLRLGVAGVAWATLIAQGISAVLAFALLLRELSRYPTEGTGLFDGAAFCDMAKVALPSILQQSTVSIGMLLVQSVVNSFGSEVLAGFTAAMRVESICVVPMAAMGNAISSFTAQNIGASEYGRVRRGYHAGYGIVFSFALIICIVLELFNRPIIAAFLGADGTLPALQTGTGYLRFMGWFFVMIGLKMITDGLLRGAGDMRMFTVANLVNLSIRVFIAVAFAPRFGIAMVWVAVPVGWSANYVLSFLQYRTGKWERSRFVKGAENLPEE
ncbi:MULTISPECIES: MATE family efflux transporter [Anaerotruncus]|uniref:MATE family efflux transporter n=1 Tax=Anaerotruncus TaxID=244127 RepID=UPI000E4B22DF|nr:MULTISPECIES: MATE family efflux transporter [Anaerotruncus]RGX54944.1 MATE family efflux transporter [Anaerotruncus sp. AF02-27]